MTGRICGTGSCVPEKEVSNHDLSRNVDTSDTWIRERTGISTRHIAESETAASMAAQASARALADAGLDAGQLDLILVATSTGETVFPNTAALVQKELGAVRASAFDVSAACTGFLAVYQIGQAYIQAGMAEHVLLIGVDVMSRLVDWTDRGTCILFGDGAGAAVLSAASGGLSECILHSDGDSGQSLRCLSGEKIRMDGREVFQFALTKVPEVIREVLEKSRIPISQIDHFLLHQANARILDGVAKRLHADPNRFPSNIAHCGNTCAASIPILMDEQNRAGRLKKGQRIILSGFGAGLTWGAAILEWQM